MRVSPGIVLEASSGSVFIDPQFRVRKGDVLISHAHSDHVRKHHATIMATEETLRVSGLQGEPLSYGEKASFNEFEITSLNAGHVPGSAMFFVENGESVLYTGDFRPRPSLFGEAEPVDCNVLVVEATYGLKGTAFPDPLEEYKKIGEWVLESLDSGESVLFGAYALGKAQEVIHALNLAGIVPVVHPRIADVTDKTGLSLEYYNTLSEEGADLLAGQFVAVVPPRMASRGTAEVLSRQSGTRVRTAVASGQPFYRADKIFRLSGHADYEDIISFVQECSPDIVYTVHGHAETLAKSITRTLEIPAKPLS